MGGHRVLDCARCSAVDDVSVADRDGRQAAGRYAAARRPGAADDTTDLRGLSPVRLRERKRPAGGPDRRQRTEPLRPHYLSRPGRQAAAGHSRHRDVAGFHPDAGPARGDDQQGSQSLVSANGALGLGGHARAACGVRPGRRHRQTSRRRDHADGKPDRPRGYRRRHDVHRYSATCMRSRPPSCSWS